MRRQLPSGNEVTRAWRVPWWRPCRCCCDEFKFEHSWTGFFCLGFNPIRNHRWRKGFVCLVCSPTPEGSRHFFGLLRPSRPVPRHRQGARRISKISPQDRDDPSSLRARHDHP